MKKRWTALLALAVAVVLAACGGGEDDRIIMELTSTPAATTAPISTQASTTEPSTDGSSPVIDGVEVRPFTVGDEVELPDDVALIIETGCVNCHCPCVFGLVHVYRDASGEVRTEDLFYPGRDASIPGYIPGAFALNDDASEIVVGVCSRGSCGPVEPPSADAQTTLYRSEDGGATWEVIDVLDGDHAVPATSEEGVQPPVEAAEVLRMISLPDGERAWLTTTGDLVRKDGSDFLAFDQSISDIAPDHAGDGFVIEWATSLEELDRYGFLARYFLGTVRPDGHLLKALSSPAGPLEFGAWLTSTQAFGHAYIIPPGVEFNGNPGLWQLVIFDFESSTIHPIAIPDSGRNVLAVVQSPSD